MKNAATFSWHDAAVSRLKVLHGRGDTFTQIARALSVEFGAPISRNAAIGKISRLGLSGSAETVKIKREAFAARRAMARPLKAPPVAKGPPNPTGSNSIKRVHVAPVETAPTASAAEREREIDAIAANPKVMLDPAWSGCRWPLFRTADDGAILSCCNTKPFGQPYCEGHQRLNFQKARTPEQIAADAKIWARNIERSGANTKATRHFNTPLEVAP